MTEDLKYAWRSLSHRRLATLTAVLCLAVGLGANTVLFGVVDALLLRPPAGVAAPAELVRVRVGTPGDGGMMGSGPSTTYPQMLRVAEQLSGAVTLAAYAPRMMTLGGGEQAEPVSAVLATGNYFAVLGVRPRLGRLFAAGEDDVPGAPPVAVLGYGAWTRRYARDPAVVGSTVQLNGAAVTVIGVAPAGFVGVDLGEPDIWLATGAAGMEAFGGERQYTDRFYWLQMVARRHAGVTPQALEHVVAGRGADPYAATPRVQLHVLPLRAMFFGDQAGENPVPPWALGITLAVLLLSCATVANLLLAQGATREREVAVRLALGASRQRILRQLLLENLLIALAAAAAATLLAVWSAGLLRLLPLPAINQLVDIRVGLFAFAVAGATTLLFGLVPAFWTARGDLEAVLRRGAVRGSRRQSALQQVLMAGQLAISFVLIVGAALFATSFRNVLRIDTGFDLDRIATVNISLAGRGMSPEQARLFVDRAVERIRHVPGVSGAATGGIVPFHMMSRGGFFIPDGRAEDDQPLSELISTVGQDYFETMGIRLAAGRPFGPSDHAGSEPVAIVSTAMARAHWREGDALNSCIRLRGRHGDACVRVVGITTDVRFRSLQGDPAPVMFLLSDQDPVAVGGGAGFRAATGFTGATIFVRTDGDPARLTEPLRRAVQSLDGGLPFLEVRPLDDRVRPARIQWEVAAKLFTAFGFLAMLLAAVGLYMVVAFMVAQRTRELGIRSALGASSRDIVALVLGRGARVTAAGIAAGAAGALAVTRLIASRLYGVSAVDPAIYAGVAALLAAVALLASSAPARAAARLDPLEVLRDE